MARSMALATGIRAAPTTEMYTRCCAPARDAACTRCRALSSSPLAVPAQCTMVSIPLTAACLLARGQVTSHKLDTLPALGAAPAEQSDVAPGVAQPRDDEPPQDTRAASDQD